MFGAEALSRAPRSAPVSATGAGVMHEQPTFPVPQVSEMSSPLKIDPIARDRHPVYSPTGQGPDSVV
jgi:hypothetical protein